jgi:hypothetical protein
LESKNQFYSNTTISRTSKCFYGHAVEDKKMRVSVLSARKLGRCAKSAPDLYLAAWSLGTCPTNSAAASTPAFVQIRNSQVITGTTNSLAFLSPNTAGNLIVVYAIWDNTSATSFFDSRGNVYQSAIGPTLWGNNDRARVFTNPSFRATRSISDALADTRHL